MIARNVSGSKLQGKLLGVLTFSEAVGLVFNPEKNDNLNGAHQITIPLEDMSRVDFGAKLGVSSQFQLKTVDGTQYTFALDDNFKAEHQLKSATAMWFYIPPNAIYGVQSYIKWRDVFHQALPPEKFKKTRPVPPAIAAILIAIPVCTILYVFYQLWLV